MATTAATVFPKMLKALRANSSVKEKREALTYISSQAKKLESSGIIKEEKYKDLCRLVIELFAKDEGVMQYEVLGALNAIVQDFKAHPLHLFESLLQTDKRTRVKVLKLLEIVEDNAISAAINDEQTVQFFEDCMSGIQSNLMEWTMPMDNLQLLTEIEQKTLTDEQKLEEDIINYSFTFLKRLYKLAVITSDQKAVEKFDRLLMSKVITLVYMGYKRQRDSALKLLQQANTINFSLRVRKDHPELWAEYKANLQSIYCKRMLLLVTDYKPDWSNLWNITIQLLGTDLHRGAGLINNLLSIEEKAFKSTDAIIRRQAFLSWKLLIDNFALDPQELASARRIKLLCIPLNAKNSKTELIALTKLEVWWYMIFKLYKDIVKFATPVITQFLNFCFGPLGDTPLLSHKFDVVASPGKKFFKTKLVAVDALYELIVPKKKENTTFYVPLLEKLPHAISHEVFQECSKSIIHSVGEALLILSQFTENDVKHIHQRGKILWASLIIYIKDLKLTTKGHLYRDVILVVTELANHIDRPIVKDMIFNVILSDINQIINNTEFIDYVLRDLVLKLLSPLMLSEVPKNFDCNTIKCLVQRCISSDITHSLGVFEFVGTIMENLRLVIQTTQNTVFYAELWSIIANTLAKYIENSKKIGDGNENGHNLKIMESILSFPFQYPFPESLKQTNNLATAWKTLYKEFEAHSDSISTIKPNEILLDVANMMRNHLNKDNCFLIVNCLDVLPSTIIYEHLLAEDGVPSIMQLIVDVVTISFKNQHNYNCETSLKILSSILITVYGHNSQKVASYLDSCRSVIELMFKSHLKTCHKEIASTWETVISIFKGLNAQLSHKLLLLYKEIIIIAMEHPDSNIRLLTRSILQIKNNLDSTARDVLEEIEGAVEKPVSHSKSNNSAAKKKDETEKESKVHTIGSFLNRKSTVAKTVPTKLGKNEKKAVTLSEPDSQDYVYIKTDLKFDVNRLTEHQKETLKRKREDIPALYNDLSQSSSQNSQNLQEWFDMKAKRINESDKTKDKSDLIVQKPNNNETNKENKITMHTEICAVDKVDNNNSNKLEENVGENVDIKQKKDQTKKTERTDSNLHNENIDTSNRAKLTSKYPAGYDVTLEMNEETDAGGSIESVAKKLNFESREEFPESKTNERQSPSMFDSVKRRHRSDKVDTAKSNSSLTNDEVAESQKDSSTNIVQKTLRMKNAQEKPNTSNKQSYEDTDVKENTMENVKSTKRKYMSDTESDRVMRQSRKRKLDSSSQGFSNIQKARREYSTIPDTSDKDNARMRTEISRLKIDMVFDCPSVNRRRIKHSEDGDKMAMWKKSVILNTKSPKYKSAEAKSAEAKSAENPKKSTSMIEKNSKNEKETKDMNDTNQGTSKRKSRRSTRDQEIDKHDSEVIKATDKTLQTKNTTDKSTTRTVSTENTANNNQDEKLDQNSSKASTSKNEFSKIDDSNGNSQNEIEDIVECSQVSNIKIKRDKEFYDKQCFIKISKLTYSGKIHGVNVEKNYVPESIPVECDENDVPDPCVQSDETNASNNTEENNEGNKNSINKNSVQETDNASVVKSVETSENQKTADTSSSMKFTNTIIVSPKNSGKIFSKLKSFTVRGRAAHMLGLVTKQPRVEDDISMITLDDDMAKKSKTKDVQNETPSKKSATVKEVDGRIGGHSGSRQEKIFSNMKLTDHTFPSAYTHTYALKNDGEKLPSKLDKNPPECTSMEISADRESDESASLSCEKDGLPILEWSSANPPSLTASPSASILKRRFTSMPTELDLDSTLSKRKRVSFADPPVSKEMGYEISIVESSHKENKCTAARGLATKKDFPPRFKQLKLKFASIDADKPMAESDVQNQSIIKVVPQDVKVSEPLSSAVSDIRDPDAMNANDPIINNLFESNTDEINYHAINIDDFAQEVEIAIDSNSSEDPQLLSLETLQNSTSIECTRTEDSETQQDLFDGMDTKNNGRSSQTSDDKFDTTIQNNPEDSFKLNVINDSVIQALPVKTDNLEDTVDIQNITELNSTANLDEIFCAKPLYSSTAENVAEQDTISVTDSIFASLPSSLDSQGESNRNNTELEPEFLDSTQPIYPTLLSCTESIDTVVGQLTNPLWRQNLSLYFSNRNLCTIGDLAQLSEREIHRMPMKGSSKVEFVRKVLRHFESTRDKNTSELQTKSTDKMEQLTDMTINEISSASITPDDDSIEKESLIINDKPTSTPLARPTKNVFDHTLSQESPASHLNETNDAGSIDTSSESGHSDRLVLHISTVSEHASYAKVPVDSSPTSTTNTTSKVVPSLSGNASTSTNSDESNVCDIPVAQTSANSNINEMYSILKLAADKTTKTAECEKEFEELLNQIDLKLLLANAIKRCSPEIIFSQYKEMLASLSEAELIKKTIGLLDFQNKEQLNDLLLQSACRVYGVNGVLVRLCDIFSSDREFFEKVLKAYNEQLNLSELINLDDFDLDEIKRVVHKKCTSSEIVEMFSDKVKKEEQDGIRHPMSEISTLNTMLQRLPIDMIISPSIANKKIIPMSTVLDVALQNNSSENIVRALKAQASDKANCVLEKLCTSQFLVEHIQTEDIPKESLLDVFKTVCSKLTTRELLDAYHQAMTKKLISKEDKH